MPSLQPAVTSANFDGFRMADIGKRYGAANNRALAVGRETLHDGPRFAAACASEVPPARSGRALAA